MPLDHCRRKDDPTLTKCGFPNRVLAYADTSRALVLCPGLLARVELPLRGRRNQLGGLRGARTDRWTNGVYSDQLSALQSNGDAQLPHRLPICRATHADAECAEACAWSDATADVTAMQASQNAQAQYGCEYSSRQPPIPLAELRIWAQGHKTLRIKNLSAPYGYMVRHHAKRLLSDAYGRGLGRGAVEANNRATFFAEEPLNVESVRTAVQPRTPLLLALRARGCDVEESHEQ